MSFFSSVLADKAWNYHGLRVGLDIKLSASVSATSARAAGKGIGSAGPGPGFRQVGLRVSYHLVDWLTDLLQPSILLQRLRLVIFQAPMLSSLAVASDLPPPPPPPPAKRVLNTWLAFVGLRFPIKVFVLGAVVLCHSVIAGQAVTGIRIEGMSDVKGKWQAATVMGGKIYAIPYNAHHGKFSE